MKGHIIKRKKNQCFFNCVGNGAKRNSGQKRSTITLYKLIVHINNKGDIHQICSYFSNDNHFRLQSDIVIKP